MITCPKCQTPFGITREYRVTNEEMSKTTPEAFASKMISELMADIESGKKPQPEIPDDATRRKLFEAAVGTLRMVAGEVPELQAAKSRERLTCSCDWATDGVCQEEAGESLG